ncbi:winged helix-turn-helix domain-containing protein [Nocardia sp. NBC_01499]|uniref:winged helix-turn-helix domain-containing protein n=1 Tax=Nocardia sp. NBC_01499 TaxID=2903597 RepID=UPI0038651C3A
MTAANLADPAHRATAAAIAVDLITAIHNGHYQPGDRLPSQTQLMTTYGVSMATAAAALRKLREHGLTTTQPGRGVYLATTFPHGQFAQTATTTGDLSTSDDDHLPGENTPQRWQQRYTDITTLYHAASHLTTLAQRNEQAEQHAPDTRNPLRNLHPTVLHTLAHTLTSTAHHIINHGPTPTTHVTITAAHHILTGDGRLPN